MSAILSFFSENFWATCIILASLSMTVTGYVNSYFSPNKVWKQVISWVVAILITVGTYFGNLITVADPSWLSLIFTGLVVGLSSNGIYEIGFMKNFIKNITSTISSIPSQIEAEKK